MKILFPTLLAVALSASAASAVTIVNEKAAGTGGFPTGGDYSDTSGANTNIFGNVRMGENQVIGDLRATGGDYADWFFFSVRSGTQVTSSTLTTSASTDEIQFTILDDTGTSILSSLPFTPGGTVDVITAAAPLGEGTYNFGLFFSSGSGSVDVDYTLSTTLANVPTTPVPLPAGMPLLLAGLGGLAAIRRRNKSDA